MSAPLAAPLTFCSKVWPQTSAGNAYVMATDDKSPTGGQHYLQVYTEWRADRLRLRSRMRTAGAWLSTARAIYMQRTVTTKRSINSLRMEPAPFSSGQAPSRPASPVGLAFDSSGNLFVSIETFSDPGTDSIVYFTPNGVKSTFATGLTFPRGLAFDSSGNLFVAEANAIPDGDILKFPPGGGSPTVFASGFGRPEFLTFGPPR